MIIPPKIVAPIANREASPAPGPMFPITSGNIAIIVLIDVIIIGLNLNWQASLTDVSIFLPTVRSWFANQLRTVGKNIETSVKEACQLRFRPIMMTSMSTMIAMLPLVIGNIGPGAGEASRLAIGATILGGMIISTLFTLYVTPTMYLVLAKNTKRIDSVDIELKKQLR